MTVFKEIGFYLKNGKYIKLANSPKFVSLEDIFGVTAIGDENFKDLRNKLIISSYTNDNDPEYHIINNVDALKIVLDKKDK